MLLFLGLLSGVISSIMVIPYVADVLKRKTHPQRASWLIWTVLGYIALSSQFAKGATNSLWMTAAQTLGTTVIFSLSLKLGTGGFGKRDIISLALAACGLVVWYFTREAAYALFVTMAVDAIGAMLTAIKAYEMPGSETLITWLLSATSGILAALSVGRFAPILLAYPLYVTVANMCVIIGVLLGYRRHAVLR